MKKIQRPFKQWCVYVRQRQYLFDTFDGAVTFGADNPDFRKIPRAVFQRFRGEYGIYGRERFRVIRHNDGHIMIHRSNQWERERNTQWVRYDETFGMGN